MNSMARKAPSSSETTNYDDQPSIEESSWTMYLEHFCRDSHHHDQQQYGSSFSSGYENHSTVSGAAHSNSISKNISNICNEEALGFGNKVSPSCPIKRKSKRSLVHDELEDTATSPANSPKVCNLYQSVMKQKLQTDHIDIKAKEKGSTSGNVDGGGTTELEFNGRESDYTELKKRGLCLVPFSTVANYFG